MQLGDMLVGVFLRFDTNGVGTMARLTGATQSANTSLLRQQKLISANDAAMLRYQQRIEKVRMGWLNLGTAMAGGIAIAGGAAIGYGVKGAAEMERALTSTAIALHVSAHGRDMRDLYRMAFNVSGMTAQDSLTIAKEMSTATTSGLNDKRAMLDAFPRIAKAADVLWMSPKNIDPVQAVQQMSTLAHLFGQYKGPGFQKMLDRATEMMYVQPEALQSLVTQGRMFIGGALARGVSEEDIFKQSMTMGQTGFLRSRGGSGLARVIEYLGGAETLTGHLSKAQRGGMDSLGLFGSDGTLSPDYYKNGHLLLQKVVDHLEHLRGSMDPAKFSNAITNAFQAQGGRYMLTVLQPSVYQKSAENWKRMNELGGVDKMWHQYTNNFLYQFNIFTTNFSNLFKAVFLPLLPQLTILFMDMGKALGKAVDFLVSHPDTAKRIGEIVIAMTGLAAMRVGAGVLLGAANALGFLTGVVGTGIPLLVRVGTLLDNVLLMGMGGKLIKFLDAFGGSVLGLNQSLSSVAKSAWAAVGGMNGIMATPFMRFFTAASVFFGTTSFAPRPGAVLENKAQWVQYLRSHQDILGKMTPDQIHALDMQYPGVANSIYNLSHPRILRKPTGPSPIDSATAPYGVNVHGNVIIQMPPGTPQQHVKVFVQSLMRIQGPTIKTIGGVPQFPGAAYGH